MLLLFPLNSSQKHRDKIALSRGFTHVCHQYHNTPLIHFQQGIAKLLKKNTHCANTIISIYFNCCLCTQGRLITDRPVARDSIERGIFGGMIHLLKRRRRKIEILALTGNSVLLYVPFHIISSKCSVLYLQESCKPAYTTTFDLKSLSSCFLRESCENVCVNSLYNSEFVCVLYLSYMYLCIRGQVKTQP